MREFILYGTAACHLCESAEALLEAALANAAERIDPIDIAASDALLAAYGTSIPVVRCRADGAELGWPFDAQQLSAWLAARAT